MNIDLRSLAAFRILLGLYFVWDVYSRVSFGRWDLAWYTSSEGSSFLDPNDTPHHGFLHRLWFYRGSTMEQSAIFLLTFCCAMGYTLGLSDVLAVPLWFLVTSNQNRNMHVHDGSDNFSRQLLLWTCFLPMAKVWKIGNTQPHRGSVVVSSIAAYGLATQILLMYLGTVCHRTVDLYGFNQVHKSEWLPPKLEAVHYALSGSFSVRENIVNQLIQGSPILSRAMTLAAMTAEFCCPILLFVLRPRFRLPFAFILVGLHGGLLVSMRLPHWQLVAIAAHLTLWIPSHLWDHYSSQRSSGSPKRKIPSTPLQYSVHHRSNMFSRCIAMMLMSYMLLNFAGERRWIKKFDNGDIGEALRISQYWVMFSTVGRTAHFLALTGTLESGDQYDVFDYVRTRTIHPIDHAHLSASEDYPSARWERALNGWASSSQHPEQQKLIRTFLKAACRFLPSATKSVEWLVDHRRILPPGSSQRFQTKAAGEAATALLVPCPV